MFRHAVSGKHYSKGVWVIELTRHINTIFVPTRLVRPQNQELDIRFYRNSWKKSNHKIRKVWDRPENTLINCTMLLFGPDNRFTTTRRHQQFCSRPSRQELRHWQGGLKKEKVEPPMETPPPPGWLLTSGRSYPPVLRMSSRCQI